MTLYDFGATWVAIFLGSYLVALPILVMTNTWRALKTYSTMLYQDSSLKGDLIKSFLSRDLFKEMQD